MAADRWHILGAGAIGSLCATALLDAGQAVSLVLRDEATLARWQAGRGLQWTTLEGKQLSLAPEVETASAGSGIRHLLICTKAYDAGKALASIVKRLAPDAPVVLLVNGLGVREELLGHWPGLNIIPATTTEGTHRMAPFEVRHAGRGSTLLGSEGVTVPPDWFTAWQDSALAANWTAAIDAALWRKLAINCAINPLTAIHRCTNGKLAEPGLEPEVRALCEEISQVLGALSYHRLAEELQPAVFEVIEQTAANRSSMLQDLEAGRRTEIDYISGHLLSRAADIGLDLPRNAALLAGVKRLESAS